MERRGKRGIIAILGVILVTIILFYPYFYNLNLSEKHKSNSSAEIIISINFGEKTLKIKEIKAGESVIKSLEKIANVTTAYGGKFVTSIDGIHQNGTYFWFYYVNGLYANTGSANYIVHSGDVIRWDFHKWTQYKIIYAEIKDFPEPLIHGYNGKKFNTTIIYENDYQIYAKKLKSYLIKMGVNVTITTSTKYTKNENIIVLGYPQLIAKDLNEKYEKLGWKYHVRNGYIIDSSGIKYLGAFGQISQSPYNPKGVGVCENVVIWIYSTNFNFMNKALNDIMNGKIESFWYFTGEKA